VHSLIEGLGLAVGSTDVRLGAVILLSILAHKATAAFSLTSLFVLGEFPKKKSILLLLLFSLMTPLGALVMTPFFAYGSKIVVEVLTGLTAGTFLWVATGDMLPEVFHTQDKRWVKLALLLAGIAVMFLLSLVGGGHAH
jgi:zinc transporter ZupT